ncbi:helix-turn-helix domain-containing protein [Sinosporangium siamense]|nr:helix-turn-helix transcriptional regulator [Sinosporangium siamense]
MNENLRSAMIRAHLRATDVAAHIAVDPKTVERWIHGRTPHPRHRRAVADLLKTDERALWPELAPRQRAMPPEIQAVYPHRWAVPRTVWRRFFAAAKEDIAILVYSGLFLAEDTGLLHLLADQARAGVHVRLLLGAPDSPTVAARGEEEGIGSDVMTARVHNALTLYRSLAEVKGVELRLHQTVLYASIYRADSNLLVNPHVYGVPASKAPVMHLNATTADGAAITYLKSYERIWSRAEPSPS